MTIISNGRRFGPVAFKSEKEFEEDVASASKLLFGPSTVFVNAKRKIESKSLGGTIPDGFFFDFSDPDDPQFYIVEVEVTQHSFFNHVFPQVTKFFAFFNNNRLQKALVDKLYSLIDTDAHLNAEFRKLVGKQEIYKFLSDLIDSSQNILLIADGPIPELEEIVDTYTDTWGRLVKFLEIRKYALEQDTIYTITPDFETIQYFEPPAVPSDDDDDVETVKHTEDYHLEGVSQGVKDIYAKIKELCFAAEPPLRFNPQKYYISIKARKNIAFLKVRKKKIRFIAMMPEQEIEAAVKGLRVVSLSQAVQDFYNGPCAAVDIPNLTEEPELRKLIAALVEYHRRA
jgi:predicted transport protein